MTDEGTSPKCIDAWHLAKSAQAQAIAGERRIAVLERGFLKNDLSEPDLDGHRKAHQEMVEASRVVKEYKIDATKRILGAVAGVLLTLIAAGFIDYLKDHIK